MSAPLTAVRLPKCAAPLCRAVYIVRADFVGVSCVFSYAATLAADCPTAERVFPLLSLAHPHG